MTQAIWKFPLALADKTVIAMPCEAEMLCVQTQAGAPMIWALVNTSSRKLDRTFRAYGTGHEHEAIQGNYIGTYQLDGGALVFHVFEELTP